MLFDLRGRRRRAVQVTYLTLAVLMGGGLVFFGIGGDVSGGLFDAFSDRGGGSDDVGGTIDDRIERTEKRLKANPDDPRLLKDLVRDNYSLAAAQTPSGATGFPKEARDEMRAADRYWQRYLKAEKGKVDDDLARVVVQLYRPEALNKPKQAQEAATVIAKVDNDYPSYLQLMQYAMLAGDTRTADLAAQKAVDLAPKGEKKAVRQQVKQIKAAQAAQAAQPQG